MSKITIKNRSKFLMNVYINDRILKYIKSIDKLPGISDVKFVAATMCIVKGKNNLQGIADQLKISYGLLRKWRTEKKFKELIKQIALEYSMYCFDRLELRGRIQQRLSEIYIGNPIDALVDTPPTILSWDEFMDLKGWDEHCVIGILAMLPGYKKELKKLLKESKDERKSLGLLAVDFQITYFINEILSLYPVKRKDLEKSLKESRTRDESRGKANIKAVLFEIGKDWSETGKLDELTIKGAIYCLHVANGNVSFLSPPLK